MCKKKKVGSLTVRRQEVDKRGQEGDEHAWDDDVYDVEQRLAFYDKVKGDILMLVALHWNVLISVSPGRLVNNLPLTIFCIKRERERERDYS